MPSLTLFIYIKSIFDNNLYNNRFPPAILGIISTIDKIGTILYFLRNVVALTSTQAFCRRFKYGNAQSIH